VATLHPAPARSTAQNLQKILDFLVKIKKEKIDNTSTHSKQINTTIEPTIINSLPKEAATT